MKILKIAGVSILVIGLVLGLTLPAMADTDSASPQTSNMPPKVLAGKVISIDEGTGTFVIQSRGQEFTVLVDSATKYFKVPPSREVLPSARNRLELRQDQIKLRPMPQKALGLARHRAELKQQVQEKLELMRRLPPFDEEATFNDIAVGARTMVWVVLEEDNLVAKLVLTIKLPTPHCVVGTVTGISSVDKTITIAPADGGDDIILSYNEKTRFILRGTLNLEGQSARAVYDGEMVAKVVFAPMGGPDLAD